MAPFRSLLSILALVASGQCSFGFARLTPETARAFDQYVEAAETRMARDLQPGRFLHSDSNPDLKAKLRGGELRVEPGAAVNGGKQADVPGGLLQDWVGFMFIPRATIADVRAILQDYDNYENFYKPDVIESKIISHQDNEYNVFLRLFKKHIITVVLNANYHVQYRMLDPRRMYVTSHSTRIAQVKNSDASHTVEEAPGDAIGLLWRLNSYWRFAEADGGVYAECEAISLSRDVPLGLGFMLKGFLESFPKASMLNTLRGTWTAVEARLAGTK